MISFIFIFLLYLYYTNGEIFSIHFISMKYIYQNNWQIQNNITKENQCFILIKIIKFTSTFFYKIHI
ncbi:MAG TPA: hypothetical protein DHV55_11830 [Clostridiaceae bacterium]|nr:hypothetical protein [Clostridiaceae bacterium]